MNPPLITYTVYTPPQPAPPAPSVPDVFNAAFMLIIGVAALVGGWNFSQKKRIARIRQGDFERELSGHLC